MTTTNKKTSISITGMHCASCAVLISKTLKGIDGVKNANVNYANETALIEHDSSCTHEKLVSVIKSAGYGVATEDNIEKVKETELKKLKSKLIVSSIFTITLLYGAMVPNAPTFLTDHIVMLLLALPVQFWIGADFYKSTWSGLKTRSANMDTLITLGTTVAFGYSIYILIMKWIFMNIKYVGEIPLSYKLIQESGVYFETSATIITLILLGKYLEAKAKSKTSDAIKKLIGLQPKTARVIKDGTTKEIPIEDLKVGDRVLVKPGEKIPIDGEIVVGDTYIDESMVTGESMPVHKTTSDKVIGATINKNGSIEIIATKVGSETLLSQIINLVKDAQGSRAPIQKLVDQISSYFVPSVIILSLLTFLIWYNFAEEHSITLALVNMISVLIIACPCALGLATPTSIIVGTGKGAEHGILIKNAEMLEIANKIKYAIFDKTGTLTQGKPKVQAVEIFDNANETLLNDTQSSFLADSQQGEHLNTKTNSIHEENKDFIESVIFSVEDKSNHPLATSITEYFKNSKRLDVSTFTDIAGLGVSAEIQGKKVLIGSKKLISEINISEEVNKKIDEYYSNGLTLVLVAIDKSLVAILGISDSAKENAKQAILDLKTLGITPVMLTGDSKKAADVIAKKLEIKEIVAEVLPTEKADVIKKYQQNENAVVAMIGDGINDAPALATANIGIAMGSGTDVAIESAGITVLRGDISLVPKSIKLSKQTMTNIKQNLIWAFGYNILLIPVAMGVLYPFTGMLLNPMLASAAMALSSVSVVTNALRLKSQKL